MKKILSALLLLPIITINLAVVHVSAQPLEIPKSEMQGQEATSGYVDENGKPLSQAEYDAINSENQKNILEKYPVITYALGGAAIGAVVWLVVNKSKLVKK